MRPTTNDDGREPVLAKHLTEVVAPQLLDRGRRLEQVCPFPREYPQKTGIVVVTPTPNKTNLAVVRTYPVPAVVPWYKDGWSFLDKVDKKGSFEFRKKV